jgi:hypothetical protein
MLMEEIFREQVEPRRKQEYTDSQMIHESKSSVANLPSQEINRTFNPCEYVEHFKNPANEKY